MCFDSLSLIYNFIFCAFDVYYGITAKSIIPIKLICAFSHCIFSMYSWLYYYFWIKCWIDLSFLLLGRYIWCFVLDSYVLLMYVLECIIIFCNSLKTEYCEFLIYTLTFDANRWILLLKLLFLVVVSCEMYFIIDFQFLFLWFASNARCSSYILCILNA